MQGAAQRMKTSQQRHRQNRQFHLWSFLSVCLYSAFPISQEGEQLGIGVVDRRRPPALRPMMDVFTTEVVQVF
jgi:hypothetical protein